MDQSMKTVLCTFGQPVLWVNAKAPSKTYTCSSCNWMMRVRGGRGGNGNYYTWPAFYTARDSSSITRSAAKCVGLDLAILVIRIRYNRCQKQDSGAGDSPAQQVKHLLPTWQSEFSPPRRDGDNRSHKVVLWPTHTLHNSHYTHTQ